MSIFSFLKGLFPFLVSAAEKTFKHLDDDVKESGINGSLFAQIIKDNVTAAQHDVEALIKDKLKLSDEAYKELADALRAEYKIPDALGVIVYLQNMVNDATSDILHNSKVQEIFSVAAAILSKGKLTWLTLAMGIGEYIYRKFVKGKDVAVKGECPKGQERNPITGLCQDPIG